MVAHAVTDGDINAAREWAAQKAEAIYAKH